LSLTPVLILAPLAAACVVGASTHSPFGETERTASRSLPTLRLGHLVGLLAGAEIALCVAALGWGLEHAYWVLARNLAGLAGLGFLASRAFGSRLSWTAPLAFVALIPLVGGGSRPGEWAWWAWSARPAEDPLSALLAASLLAVGLLSACLLGAREHREEAE
jgi:hypothetical protein